MSKPIALYIHFPFCRSKCRYCDFLSFPQLEKADLYIDALIHELKTAPKSLFEHSEFIITSIFIGGGTPSLMTPEHLKRLMEELRHYPISPTAEISMECNPGTLTPQMLRTMSEAKINRISIGLQSPDNKILSYLGRIHTYEEFEKNFYNARSENFNNINIDLMSALPGQSVDDYTHGLQQILKLKPEHISAYSLIIEEGTPFYSYYEENKDIGLVIPPLPDEEEERAMYHETKHILKAFGYERYEISNYAKKGFECRHNSAYWTRQDYLGLGLGASSLIDNVRFSNTSDFNKYISFNKSSRIQTIPDPNIHDFIEVLTLNEQMEEFMFLGLRLTTGINIHEFSRIFKRKITDIYGDIITKHCADGTMTLNHKTGQLSLTERGLDVSNMIMSDFLLD